MTSPPPSQRAFTLVEMLVVIVILAVLATLAMAGFSQSMASANTAASMSNLKQFAVANLAYASDHGTYCPARSEDFQTRWHGGTAGAKPGHRWNPASGFLGPYLHDPHHLEICPLFKEYSSRGFETGGGGYGYNAIYIGGTPIKRHEGGLEHYASPERPANVPRPAQTVMFTTSALSTGAGLTEYPFSEPPYQVTNDVVLASPMQPSTHFRAQGGRAVVAWCDGHVSLEKPNGSAGMNIYGGNNTRDGIGWFGPVEANGYWNPRYREQVGQ